MNIIIQPKLAMHLERPVSYTDILNYIFNVNSMSDITPVDEIPIRAMFLNTLISKKIPLQTFLDELEELSVPKGEMTDLIEAEQPILLEAVNDFISSFNKAIKRGEYTAASRGFYGLALDSDNLPIIKSREQLTTWSRNLINGEADRIEIGGVAMSHPQISTVTNLLTTFKLHINAQQVAIDAFTRKEDELKQFMPSVTVIVNKCINDTTNYFGELEPSNMRKNCRKWGIKFKSVRVGNPIVYNVLVPMLSTANVTGLEVAPNTEMEITSTCDTELYLCLTQNDTDACTLQNLVVPPRVTIKIKASEIGSADNTMVNVTNPNDSRDGSCTITV